MVFDHAGDGATVFAAESGPLPFRKDILLEVPEEPGIYLYLDARGSILFIGSADETLGLARQIEADYNSPRWREVTHFKWAVTRDRTHPEHLAQNLAREFDPPFNRSLLSRIAS